MGFWLPGAMYGGVTAPAFETGTGEKLTLTLSGSGTVAGHVAYVLV